MRLHGQIVSARDGSPIVDAVVMVDPGASPEQTVGTGPDGRFAVDAYVGNGAAIASIEKEGFPPTRKILNLNGVPTMIRLEPLAAQPVDRVVAPPTGWRGVVLRFLGRIIGRLER